MFANVVNEHYQKGNILWCHDYHLMFLLKCLKEANPNMKVGWFLHTPFPSSEIHRTVFSRSELLTTVLPVDLVGFHTYDYARHVMSAYTRILGQDQGRLTRVAAGFNATITEPVNAPDRRIDQGVWDKRCFRSKAKAAGILIGHLEGIKFLDNRNDGCYFISNGKDQTIKLWDIHKMFYNASRSTGSSSSATEWSSCFFWREKLLFDAKETVGLTKPKSNATIKTGGTTALVTLDGEVLIGLFNVEDETRELCFDGLQNISAQTMRFMKIDLDDKTDVLTYHKKLLAEAVKEKEELKTKLENFQSSSKGLSKLLNSQMSKRDKSRLGYGDQVHDGVLSMHTVPPPMTGNYMPSGPDREIDDYMFTYGPKQYKTSESDNPKRNYDLYESDSDDEYVIQPLKEQERPSFAFINTVKHVKTPRETVKEQNTYSPSPKANKKD
ncbi:ribonuclease H-like domain-containing protein [Tanacetum coccineum]